MGRNEQFEGVYPREASILINFQWEGRRHRERLELRPTAANIKAAARIRDEIVSAIRIDKFTLDDYQRHFPGSVWIKRNPKAFSGTFEAVVEAWEELAEQDLAGTTMKEYRNTLNREFMQEYGDRQIASITYEELAVYMVRKKIASAKTFNNIMTPLRQVFAFAVKAKRINTDITREIGSRKNQKPGPDPLDLNEIETVLKQILKAHGEQWHNYFEFAFFSGLRPSEQIAFKWPNVDFRREQARIDEARVRAIDKGVKTHRSRDIDLQTRALQALIRQKKHTFMAGEYVFHNPFTGGRLHDTGPAVRLVWRPALKAVGIRDRDAKQTRHSFATLCLHAGMNPAYVARQMGHTNARMFFEVYSKWMDGEASGREKSKMDLLLSGGKAVKAL